MPPRRAIKKEVSVDLSSDSGLSSAQSVDEENGILEQHSPTIVNTLVQQEPKSRKRRAQPLTSIDSPKKRIKTAKVKVFEESLEKDNSTLQARGIKRTKITTKTEVGVDGVQTIETPVQLEESATKRTRTSKKSRTKRSVTEGNKIEKTAKELQEAGKEGVGGEQIVDGESKEDIPKKITRHRKTKEEKEAEAMPLAARTVGLQMFIGAHVSAAKGVHNAVTNAVHIGGNSFALFLKSQRKWENPPMQDEHRDQFKLFCQDHKFNSAKFILPHGSYLVNLAQEDPDRAKQAYDAFLDDLQRCESLGIKLYNFHPGNTGPASRPSAITRIAKALNQAHAETKTVKPVLENMAGKGNVIGATFEDLRDIIELVEDKARIGVCIDTCHSFVAGYDLRTPEAFKKTIDHFDNVVGIKYLSALHINDSKSPFHSHRDLHQNIGTGFLGLRAFHNIMNEPRFEGLPMVLETPIERKDANGKDIEDKSIWAKEIKLLESLIGMDPDGEEFRFLETSIAAQGEEERKKYQEQYDRKQENDRQAAKKAKGKGKSKKEKKREETAESASEDSNN